MSLIYNNCSYDGYSQVKSTENENPVTVMSMSANMSNGYVTINKSFSDVELYKANKETADADYSDFEERVYKAFGIIDETVAK